MVHRVSYSIGRYSTNGYIKPCLHSSVIVEPAMTAALTA